MGPPRDSVGPDDDFVEMPTEGEAGDRAAGVSLSVKAMRELFSTSAPVELSAAEREAGKA